VTAVTTFRTRPTRTVDGSGAGADRKVIGAQFGSSAGARLRAEQQRLRLALIVLAVCAKLGYDLVARPRTCTRSPRSTTDMPARRSVARLLLWLVLATTPCPTRRPARRPWSPTCRII
jgi:hypothetical protein